MNLQAVISKVWPEVRKRHLFPELPTPQIAESGDEAVSIQMKGKTILLDQEVLEALAKVMPVEDAASAMLDHGVSHHTVCPWDFETHLKLYAQLKPVLMDGEVVKQVVNYFMDVVADTHAVRERDSKMADVYKQLPSDPVSDVVRALYQRLWGKDLGVKDVVESDRLARIPYLDAAHWGESIRSFAQVMGPLIAKMGDGEGGQGSGGMMGDHGLEQYSAGEIEDALEAFSEQGFYAFRAMVDDFKDELEKKGMMPHMGRGKGTPSDADMLYYMKRAAAVRLPVHTMPLEKVGGEQPFSHIPWEIGKPVQEIDVWTSFGKVLPGVSQMWKWKAGETHGDDDGIPDCLIVIDSSGSMTDPNKELSHAVLGAGCAADAYLRKGRRVAVYNFSDAQSGGKEILDFCRDRDKVFWVLCRYFGGGTSLDVPDLASLLKEKVDVFLITDMQITNLDALTQFLAQSHNRVTAVHIGRNEEVELFRARVQNLEHICVYAVEKTEDIPDIVIGEVRARFR
jgi:hypothetical protein